MPQRHSRILATAPGLLLAAAVGAVLLIGDERRAHGYIDNPDPTLAQLCKRSTEIAVLRVEKVNREKRGIVYRKVRDLKGNFASEAKQPFIHVLLASSQYITNPSNSKDAEGQQLQNLATLDRVADGQKAVAFQVGGLQLICLGHDWYTLRVSADAAAPLGGACDARFARFFCGDVDQLVAAVTDLLAGKPVTVPRMAGSNTMLSDRSAPIRCLRADDDDALDRRKENGVANQFRDPFAGQLPWATYRGDPWRTGGDGGPGAKTPRVLWAHKSESHFVAPLVPGTGVLYASSLGAFNTPGFHAFALDSAREKQLRWSKGPPLLRFPIAAAPALLRGDPEALVFGDGFHTDEGGSLRCLRAADGFPLWQFAVAGDLIHFEGTPTVAGGKLFAGGGNAGVLCLDPNKVTVDGKEHTLRSVQGVLEQRWKELLAKYDGEKKKDPQFALPPTEDMLPRPAPKQLWQQGKGKWHVDAPVAVVEDRVLAASAYLDDEKAGERALFCLNTKDGEAAWKVPLKLNPWAGPTVGPYVLVGCSSIRLDPKAIAGAAGEVVAVELDTGKVRWRRDVPGGVLSSVAVREGLAIFTATDGKVRAWDAFTGQERWTYEAGAPFFAGVAVAGRTVYAADQRGVVHAISLADGKKQWTLDLATDLATKAPGMVYGAPVVHGGRLYVATCNLGDGAAGTANLLVCIGEK
jgi:outer membrane protein assembly factor BamB